MTSQINGYRLLAGVLGFAVLLIVFACNIASQDGRTYINVTMDTAWAAFDSLEITWKDSSSGASGILFQGDPAVLKETNKLPADGYSGQAIVVTFKGFKSHVLAFEERRSFDGNTPGIVIRQIVPVGPSTNDPDRVNIKKRPALSEIRADSIISIGDSVSFNSDATLEEGSLKSFSWDYLGTGDYGAPRPITGNSAPIAGGFRFPEKGAFRVSLKVLSDADSAATRQILISVLQDEPIADAGPDVSVYAGGSVALHGIAKDNLGKIVKTEWKIGAGAFSIAPGDTGITAPGAPQDMQVFFRVTDDDGQTSTDSMLVHVVSGTESNLVGLTVSAGRLSPQFNPSVLAYTDTVAFDVESFAVTATGAGEITVNNDAVASGTPSRPIALNEGVTAVTVAVKLPDVPGKTYTLTVVRPSASANTNLASLSTSAGPFDTAFTQDDTLYEASVPNGTSSVMVTGTLASASSMLTINGFAISSGAASGAINLNDGANSIAIVVTAQNGDRKTYVIVIHRAGNGNTELGALDLSAGVFSPAFSQTETSYSLSVSASAATTQVTAKAANPSSALFINGKSAVSGVGQPVDLVVGSNLITVLVKAQNGDEKSYTVKVTRAGNGNADLGALAVSAGSLEPAFDPAAVFYALSVGNTVLSATLTATVANAGSALSINGQPAVSGEAFPVNLAVGVNAISIAVTAQNGDKKSYTAQITRAGNGNADLSKLSVSHGVLIPAFSPETAAYALSVPNGQASIDILGEAADVNALLTFNDVPVESGTPAPTALAVGDNRITVVVTAQDGSNKTYAITATRERNGNTELEGLILSAGPISPALDPAILSYSVDAANGTASTTVSAKTIASTSTLTVNGTAIPSGATSAAIPLNVGANSINLVITAQNGNKKTYSVQVTRAGDGNTELSALSLSEGAISPVFTPARAFYSLSVANSVTTTKVTPTVSVATSTVTVNGAPVTSGNESDAISLVAGANAITIVVTSQSGAKNTYSVEVTRAGNGNADLSGLSLSAGSLSPAFATATAAYAITVANGVTATTVTPGVAEGTSTVAVNGTPVASGTASAFLPLSVGANTITIVVTAQNGSAKTYSVVVTRIGDGNANLSGLSASAGAISPAFAAGTASYAMAVGNTVASTTISPTVSASTSNVNVNGSPVPSGSASGEIALGVGTNVISVVVTAQSGVTKTYTVTVSRAGDANTNLSDLSASTGTLSPAFAAATTLYGCTVANDVASTTVTPTVAIGTSTITVNGIDVASGTASAPIALTIGANPIPVVVTAQNGSTKTYTIQVTRSQNGNADLSGLALSAGAISPAFATATTSYSLSVPNETLSTTVTPTLAVGTSTMTVNGVDVTSGAASGSISLGVGANTVIVVVKAQNGTAKSYTLTVTRAQNANANLSALSPSAGSLSPAFASGTSDYSITVSNAIASMTFTPTVSAATSSVKVNGAAVASGAASGAMALVVGSNSAAIAVTAQNGSVRTYSVNVTRGANANADLSGLTLSTGALNPAFASGTTAYASNVANSVVSTKVTPTVLVGTSTVKVNGATVASGAASADVDLALGVNTVTVEVTAENGGKKTYTLTITRKIVAAMVACGQYTSFAIMQDGTLRVWGLTFWGQGNIPPGKKFKGVAGGWRHVVGLVEDGTVLAWGENSQGQLDVPAGLSGVVAVAAGEFTSAALKSDGTVVVWGANGSGQCNVPAGLTGVKAIAAGDLHVVALLDDGSLVGWGNNGNDQRRWPPGLVGVKAIAAAPIHTVAILEDGTVGAWGTDFHGQTTVPPGLSGVKAISANGENSFAVKTDGTIVGWGRNDADVGQLNIPLGTTGVKATATGLWHSIALKNDGTVIGWGNNSSGEITIPADLQ